MQRGWLRVMVRSGDGARVLRHSHRSLTTWRWHYALAAGAWYARRRWDRPH